MVTRPTMFSPIRPSSLLSVSTPLTSTNDINAIVALIVVFLIGAKWYLERDLNHYPPGPKSLLPYIRNAFQLPVIKPWLVYAEWAKKYGSTVIYARAFGGGILVLNSYDDAVELLEKRASISSDRPPVLLLELLGWGDHVPITRYGDVWRKQRRMLHQSLKKDGEMKEHFRPIVEESGKRMLKRFVEADPSFAGKNATEYFRQYSGEFIISLTYGYKFTDPVVSSIIKDVSELVEIGSASVLPGAHLINIFPIVQYFPRWAPGGGFHKLVETIRPLMMRVKETTYHYAKAKSEKSRQEDQDGLEELEDPKLAPRKSMVGQWLQVMEKEAALKDTMVGKTSETVIQDMAVAVFGAGYHTTAVSLSWFILAMAKYPEIQKKAQDSIRSVLGPNRLPTWDDRPSLPYLEAIYMETLRWRVVTPMAMPHQTVEDDVYKGYYIPAGTMILPNVWEMTRNEKKYPDPEEFKPERYLNEDGSVKYDERILAYGFGRRICVGRSLASDAFWLAMVVILASLHIGKEKDEHGNDVEITDDLKGDVLIYPLSMPCTISKREDFEF